MELILMKTLKDRMLWASIIIGGFTVACIISVIIVGIN